MFFKTSQDSLKKIARYVSKVPFTKKIIHRLSEAARGKAIVFFSFNRIISEAREENMHWDESMLTPQEFKKTLKSINKTLAFISMKDAIKMLTGEQRLQHSKAVLLLESAYSQTIATIMPILKELHIPVCIMLTTDAVQSGNLPWMDEVFYRIGSTSKDSISLTYIDRSFLLDSPSLRKLAAQHIIEHLSHCRPEALKTKLAELRESLYDGEMPLPDERISSHAELSKLAEENSLVSFGCAGQFSWPFYDIALDDAKSEIVRAKEELLQLFDKAFVPVFLYPLSFDKRRSQELINLMIDAGYEAAISRNAGICHPGDNMFRLMRLPLGHQNKTFEQFELMGLSDAIEEFLLVTLAKEKEF